MKRLVHHALCAPLLVGLLLAIARGQEAQNGQLVDSTVVTLPDDLKRALAHVDIKVITYLSDGLKVKGYLAAPKNGSKLPCVIYNRGGNREFGALDDLRAARLLGHIASWGYVAVGSQYRGNAGGEGMEEFGGKDVHPCS